jgi:HEAT repeat protein
VPQLIKLLDETDDGLKTQVLGALAAIGPDAADAVEPITKALDDNSDRVASAACIALGRIGPAAESAMPVIEKHLKNESVYTQLAGAWALVHIERDPSRVAKKVLPLLIKSLNSPVELVQIHAAETLAALGPAAKPAVKELKHAAADSNPAVSQAAISALAAIEKQSKQTKPK